MKGIRIFKGRISEQEVASLKAQYPDVALGKTVSTDNKGELHDIVFRPISDALYTRIRMLTEEGKANGEIFLPTVTDGLIFDECLLWPEISADERKRLEVSVIPVFSKKVQEFSGFFEVDAQGNWIGNALSILPLKDHNYWGDYSLETLKELKETTPFALFRVRIGKWVFIQRPLTSEDVAIAQTQPDDLEIIAKASIMWPTLTEDIWRSIPVGVKSTVANTATKISMYNLDDADIIPL